MNTQQDTSKKLNLAYQEIAKLFVLCGIVCLEFFFIHFILAIVLKAMNIHEYLFQSIVCTFVVLMIMYHRYSLNNISISLNGFIHEIFIIKTDCSTLIITCLGLAFVLLLRYILYITEIDPNGLYVNIMNEGKIDYSFIIDSIFFSVVTEEIALRRSLHNTVKTYTTLWKKYLIPITGLWFGLIHFVNMGTSSFSIAYVLFQMVYGVIGGCCFGIFYEHLGILPSMIIHAMNNFIAIFIPFEFSLYLMLYSILTAALFIFAARLKTFVVMSVLFWKMMFDDHDKDHNGKLSKKEILPGLYRLLFNRENADKEELAVEAENDAILNLIFDLCDGDGDEELDFMEFLHFTKCFDVNPKTNVEFLYIVEFEALFKAIDTDFSGRVSTSEIKNALSIVDKSNKYRALKKSFESLENYAKNLEVTEAVTLNGFIKSLIRKDDYRAYRKEMHKELFNLFDKNHNNKLDKHEIAYLLQHNFPKGVLVGNANSIFMEVISGDVDNELSLKEVIPLLDSLEELDQGGYLTKNMFLETIFRILDKNGDGAIDSHELENFLDVSSLGLSNSQKSEIFDKCNTLAVSLPQFLELEKYFN
ncbi:EF-hand domain-containing protein [Entamoeba marina]